MFASALTFAQPASLGVDRSSLWQVFHNPFPLSILFGSVHNLNPTNLARDVSQWQRKGYYTLYLEGANHPESLIQLLGLQSDMSRFTKFVAEDSRHNLAKESDRSVVIVVSKKCLPFAVDKMRFCAKDRVIFFSKPSVLTAQARPPFGCWHYGNCLVDLGRTKSTKWYACEVDSQPNLENPKKSTAPEQAPEMPIK